MVQMFRIQTTAEAQTQKALTGSTKSGSLGFNEGCEEKVSVQLNSALWKGQLYRMKKELLSVLPH